MDFAQWEDLQGNNLNQFVENYRKALEEQQKAAMTQLEQQRKDTFGGLMASANRAGMLYSNFPARSKIKYDTSTYYPAVEKAQTSYQTGLDTLRDNAVKIYNQIQDYKKSIEDLNES